MRITLALKTTIYWFNIVLIKVVPKTPFELWARMKPNLWHLHTWECQIEINIYNPQEKKLDARTISAIYIDYLEN